MMLRILNTHSELLQLDQPTELLKMLGHFWSFQLGRSSSHALLEAMSNLHPRPYFWWVLYERLTHMKGLFEEVARRGS